MLHFTGSIEAKFWDGTHELSDDYKVLYDQLVPGMGEAATLHGELLRNVSRLQYDIYNNGLCNDKIAEVKYLIDALPLLGLTDKASNMYYLLLAGLGAAMENNDDDESGDDYGILWTQAMATKLDDLTAAIVAYVKAEAAK